MASTSVLDNALDAFVSRWSKVPGVSGIIVFGTYLTGKMGKYSDLDLVVVRTEDFPLESCVYVENDVLLNVSVVGLDEFHKALNAGCLNSVRLALARCRILYDADGRTARTLQNLAPCTRSEVDKYSLTVLYRFLLQLGRGENYFTLGETLDSLHYLFHAIEEAIRIALLRKGLPFDRDHFAAGLHVCPELIAAISDILGKSTYDLALVSQLLERLKEEKEVLLESYKPVLLEYFPASPIALSELKRMPVFSETDNILFASYVEHGTLLKTGIEREVPGFPAQVVQEIGFVRA
ncbi:MAG: nucleotidyltransferase domain-containing protein [Candidatus Brocadiia bacterium]